MLQNSFSTKSFRRRRTGRRRPTPRWKECTGSASGAFSAAVGKEYVRRHFDDGAKRDMLEMVADIREEFAKILDQVISYKIS